ncbi:MAG TPA: HD domain-containing phosphohydrolase [Capsulimonadaceae bacterium]|jgi:HD-GYP domain-containing protein (c-di-GMP phosphodiesterase class II)
MLFPEMLNLVCVASATGCGFAAFAYPRIAMQRATRATCIALARAAESREPHMIGHSERTAEIVVAMATRSLKFAPWQIWDLEAAALLHLVGKIGISHELLNNSATPSSRAWVALREYVRLGTEFIEGMDNLGRGAETVAAHREYIDGTGYPLGRRGTEIPFAARLLCVATEYVAMTSPRIYRANGETMSPDQALDTLRLHAGVRYDTDAVNLLAAVVGSPTQDFATRLRLRTTRLGAVAR